MNHIDRTINAYESGFVQRYHTHPRFARFGQNDGHHSYGVAALMICLHPHPSGELLRACIVHDQGERFAGDLPAPVKRDNPALAAEHAVLEKLQLQKYFFRGNHDMDERDTAWLKAIDMLECYMFASLTVPEALTRKPWMDLGSAILTRAYALDPLPLADFSQLMSAARIRQGFHEAPTKVKYK